MDISLSLKRHIEVHLKNPQNNYILSEKCRHCKHDRRISYGTNFKTPKSLKTQTITPINYNNIYRYYNSTDSYMYECILVILYV